MSPPTLTGAAVRGLVSLNVVRAVAGVPASTGVVGCRRHSPNPKASTAGPKDSTVSPTRTGSLFDRYGGARPAEDRLVVRPSSSRIRRSLFAALTCAAASVRGRATSVGTRAGSLPAASTISPYRLV